MDPLSTNSPILRPPSVECPTQAAYDELCKKKRLVSSDSVVDSIREKSLKPNPPVVDPGFSRPKTKNYALKRSALTKFVDGNYEWTSPITGKLYSGKWFDGEFVSGTAIGKVYEATGSFRNFELHGGGIIKMITHPEYESLGCFANGKLEGQGYRRMPSGKGELCEKGNFSQDLLHGKGLRIQMTMEGDITLFEEGEFREGKLHGLGVREIENKLRWKGQFIDGEFVET